MAFAFSPRPRPGWLCPLGPGASWEDLPHAPRPHVPYMGRRQGWARARGRTKRLGVWGHRSLSVQPRLASCTQAPADASRRGGLHPWAFPGLETPPSPRQTSTQGPDSAPDAEQLISPSAGQQVSSRACPSRGTSLPPGVLVPRPGCPPLHVCLREHPLGRLPSWPWSGPREASVGASHDLDASSVAGPAVSAVLTPLAHSKRR